MTRVSVFACIAALLLLADKASAADPEECQARIVVAVTDDMGHTWNAGSVLPVDILRAGANGGAFCASGGSCLPRMVKGRSALTLLNCRIGPALGGGDFRLVPDAGLSGPAAAARLRSLQNTTDKLSSLGFSNAAAGSLAAAYVNQPHSRDGQLVGQALAGSQSAIVALKRNNP